MALTFETIDLTKPVHENAAAQGLVLGFMVSDYEANTETLYYVNAKAEMFTSGAQRPNIHFRAPNGWSKIDTIPMGAEFIGHYYPEEVK